MDIEELRKISLRLSSVVEGFRERGIVNIIAKEIPNEPRIKLLRGLRGVGKTTILLQLFKKYPEKGFYISVDNPIVKNESLYDIGKELITRGFQILFIDEIHTYPKWRSEIKALYDAFPLASFICSGSAPLALIPERREKEFTILPLTLGEMIYLKTGKLIKSEDEWMSDESTLQFLADNPDIEKYSIDYRSFGAFPSSFTFMNIDSEAAIYATIRKSIREDAVVLMKMSLEKSFAMERFIMILATSPAGELSITKISNQLGLSKVVAYEIIDVLIEMKILRMVRPQSTGYALIRGEPKLLFSHPNLRVAICSQLKKEPDIGAVREELALFIFELRGYNAYTIKGTKKSPDYILEKDEDKFIVEIGGRSKTTKQLKEFEKQFKTKVLNDNHLNVLLCYF